jgi:hypothetical protein
LRGAADDRYRDRWLELNPDQPEKKPGASGKLQVNGMDTGSAGYGTCFGRTRYPGGSPFCSAGAEIDIPEHQ